MSDTGQKSVRKPLTNDLRLEITRELQLLMLSEISRRVERTGIDRGLIFHGGTSLSIIHGSDRSSEDLDFMATPEAVKRLFGGIRQMEASLQMRVSALWPGAVLALTDKTAGAEPSYGDVDRMMLRWEHRGLIGAIRVKVEFFICPEVRLGRYLSAPQPIAAEPARGLVRAAIPVSIWADKIVAMALRPALKHRDMHDLGVLSAMVPAEADRRAALVASMGIYDRAAQDIQEGLRRDLVLAADTDVAGFSEDMRRWFGEAHVQYLEESGHLTAIFGAFLQEAAIGRELVCALAEDRPEAGSIECRM